MQTSYDSVLLKKFAFTDQKLILISRNRFQKLTFVAQPYAEVRYRLLETEEEIDKFSRCGVTGKYYRSSRLIGLGMKRYTWKNR